MHRALTALIVLALLASAPAALARDRSETLVIDACRDEKVDGHYSQRDYRKALDQIPTDADEYTACRDVIHRAQLAAAAGSRRDGDAGAGTPGTTGNGTGSGGGASAGPAPNGDPLEGANDTERKAVEAAGKGGAKPVEIAGGLVRPDIASADAALPTPLLASLALLAAVALGGSGWVLYTRVLARRAG